MCTRQGLRPLQPAAPLLAACWAQRVKTTGNENISKVFLEDRIETLVTDDKLEIKHRPEKISYCFNEKVSNY